MSKIEEESYFTVGVKVEVGMERPGYRDSFYIATVITPPVPAPDADMSFHTKNKKVTTVEYKHIMEDGRRLRETVDVLQLRPIPPMEIGEVEFNVCDRVNAFFRNGWWEVVVLKVLDGGRRYGVFFRDTRKLVEFEGKDLRVHREWVYGDWVPPLLEEDDDESSTISDS